MFGLVAAGQLVVVLAEAYPGHGAPRAPPFPAVGPPAAELVGHGRGRVASRHRVAGTPPGKTDLKKGEVRREMFLEAEKMKRTVHQIFVRGSWVLRRV